MYASLVVSIECVRECDINNIRMCAPVCVCVSEYLYYPVCLRFWHCTLLGSGKI